MSKTYNTPKRNHIVKTRLDDEEHAEFMRQLNIYGMNQSEFIREAISGATIRPVIVASNINDALLEAIGKLTLILILGDSAGARTQDPILKRDVLYLLSY